MNNFQTTLADSKFTSVGFCRLNTVCICLHNLCGFATVRVFCQQYKERTKSWSFEMGSYWQRWQVKYFFHSKIWEISPIFRDPGLNLQKKSKMFPSLCFMSKHGTLSGKIIATKQPVGHPKWWFRIRESPPTWPKHSGLGMISCITWFAIGGAL